MVDLLALGLVGLGGSAGALSRYTVSRHIETDTLDTLVVNTVGSLLLGFFVAASLPTPLLALAGTGFCGAFTTFSTAAVETVDLAERAPLRAVGTVAVMLLLALGGVLVGTAIAGVL